MWLHKWCGCFHNLRAIETDRRGVSNTIGQRQFFACGRGRNAITNDASRRQAVTIPMWEESGPIHASMPVLHHNIRGSSENAGIANLFPKLPLLDAIYRTSYDDCPITWTPTAHTG